MVLVIKNLLANAGDIRDKGLIPVSGRTPEGGHGNPLQYSCLENPMKRGVWQASVHKVTKSETQLKRLSTTTTHQAYACVLCNVNGGKVDREEGVFLKRLA